MTFSPALLVVSTERSFQGYLRYVSLELTSSTKNIIRKRYDQQFFTKNFKLYS